MKRVFMLFCSLLISLACNDDSDATTIDYQIEGNTYAVVIVQDGISLSSAKERAMKRAAEVAKKNGYRYFSIVSESEVQAVRSKRNTQPQGNLYYDLIESDNFGRERFEDASPGGTRFYPAYRITFDCFQEKPSNQSFDACSYIPCK
ncbi:MAG: hypothetical protein JSS61_00755 [Verrucomicrobia bacterium]|nr:hypothetical protein [Verrucomicrobiota bacterium]